MLVVFWILTAIHPVQVISVSSVQERVKVLAGRTQIHMAGWMTKVKTQGLQWYSPDSSKAWCGHLG